jgi:hypothetical protein
MESVKQSTLTIVALGSSHRVWQQNVSKKTNKQGEIRLLPVALGGKGSVLEGLRGDSAPQYQYTHYTNGDATTASTTTTKYPS